MSETDTTLVTPETHLIVDRNNEEEMNAFFSLISIDATTGCYNWTGYLSRYGYGLFFFNGKNIRAHRWSYAFMFGPIPKGCKKMQVDHLCKNKRCVHPMHLELVTPRENTLRADGPSSTNARKISCKRGHPFDSENTYFYKGERCCRICQRLKQQSEHAKARKKNWHDQRKVLKGRPKGSLSSRSKLTESDVLQIRHLYATKQSTQIEIGERFGVDNTTICDIVRRKTWKHI